MFDFINLCSQNLSIFHAYSKSFKSVVSVLRGDENRIFPPHTDGNYCFTCYSLISYELLLKATYYLITEVTPVEYKDCNKWVCFTRAVQKLLFKYAQEDDFLEKKNMCLLNVKKLRDLYYVFKKIQQNLAITNTRCVESENKPVNNESAEIVCIAGSNLTNHVDFTISETIRGNNLSQHEKTSRRGDRLYFRNSALLLLDSDNEFDVIMRSSTFVDALFDNINSHFTHPYFDVIVRRYKDGIHKSKVNELFNT